MYRPHNSDRIYRLLIKAPRGSMYREKRMGPRTEPWGTPHVKGAGEETKLSIVTEKLLIQIGGETVEGRSRDAYPLLKSLKENEAVNRVRSCTKVEQQA